MKISAFHLDREHEAAARLEVRRPRSAGPMPVLHARRDPDDVSRPDLVDGAAPLLHAADARGHDQDLAERMGVPGRAGTGLERDGRARRARRIGRLEHGIDADPSR